MTKRLHTSQSVLDKLTGSYLAPDDDGTFTSVFGIDVTVEEDMLEGTAELRSDGKVVRRYVLDDDSDALFVLAPNQE